MVYVISFILFLTGVRSILFLIYRHQRIKKIEKLVNFSVKNEKKASVFFSGPALIETQLEKTFKKNSKLISVASDLDKNVKIKFIFFVALVSPVLLSQFAGWTDLDDQMLLIVFLLILSIVIIAPSRIQSAVINHQTHRIVSDIPFVIELLAVCIQSGMTVEASLKYIAGKIELINKNLSSLLGRTVMRADVSGIDTALQQLSDEVNNEEIRMLCSALLQSTKFGSSVYVVLIDLAKDIRQKHLLTMEEKVAALSAKMTIPMIVFILFPLLAIVAGPGLIKMSSSW